MATLISGISCLYTLAGAAAKQARHSALTDLSPIKNAVMIENRGVIEWVGSAKKIPSIYKKRGAIKKEIDAEGRIAIPAFLEPHTHLVFAGNRADEFERRNLGESYQSIAASGGGILSTVRATRNASPKELIKDAQERLDRFLSQGVTTVEVKSGYGLTVKDELRMLEVAKKLKGARVVPTFLGAHAIPHDYASDLAYVKHLVEFAFPLLKKNRLASRVDIFVEKNYFGEEAARVYLAAAREYGFDITVHADQLSRSGGSMLAIEFGAKSADHLVQVSALDIARLGKSEVACVLLPSADLYMKCAYPPARALIEAGARISLATDFNPGTSPSQDLALVGVLARLEMKMTLPEIMIAYTLGNAYALGLQTKLGSLETGKECDFALLNCDFSELFLSIGRMPIETVYRSGQQVFSR